MRNKKQTPPTHQELPTPQYIYNNMRFKAVALQPPDFKPGSWIGAGKILIDPENRRFILTARPRKAERGVRGYAANVYDSKDGEKFKLLKSISKEEISEKSQIAIHSIEGTQLLKDPISQNWHFYVSVDTGAEFVWGGLYWETLLLVSDDLNGPWESKGLVIKHDQNYDANQARDASIDIIDRKWICLYRAHDKDRNIRMALATSNDGIKWNKQGVVSIDGEKVQPLALSGTIFQGTTEPIFLGIVMNKEPSSLARNNQVFYDEGKVPHGMLKFDFSAYRIQLNNKTLNTVFRKPWKARSRYEHKEYPIFGYCSLAFDLNNERVLIYVSAIDPKTKKMGLNETIERVLVYECKINENSI